MQNLLRGTSVFLAEGQTCCNVEQKHDLCFSTYLNVTVRTGHPLILKEQRLPVFQAASFHPCTLLPITWLIRKAWDKRVILHGPLLVYNKIEIRPPCLSSILKQPCHYCNIVPGSTVNQYCCVKTWLSETQRKVFRKVNSIVPNENLSLLWANIILWGFCVHTEGGTPDQSLMW